MKKFHALSLSGVLLVLAILAAGNYVLSVFPARLDTSAGRAYSISRASKDVLKKLDDRLTVRIVFSKNLPAVYQQNQRYVADLLSEYRRASGGRIRVENVDPGSSPKARELAMEWGVVPVQLDVVERDRREVAEKFMGVAFSYGDRTEAIPLVQDVQGLEYEITVRIRKLIDPTKPVIAFLQNGGAQTPQSRGLDALAEPLNALYDVKTGDASDPIPDSVKAVLWVAPVSPSSPTVHANLSDYLARGGSVGVLLDQHDIDVSQFRARPVSHDIDPLLASWGISVGKGFVVDPQCDRIQIRAMQGSFQMVNIVDYAYFPVVTAIDRTHPASRGIESFTTPFCSPVAVSTPLAGVSYYPIGRTTRASYLDERPLFVSPLNQPLRDDSATAGPFNVAMLAQGQFPNGSKPGRLVVFGTSRLVRSEYPMRPSNYALLLNYIDWLAQDDTLIQIRSRGYQRRPLRDFPPAARLVIKYAIVLTLPVLALGVGALVWRRQSARRRRVAQEYGGNP